MAANTQKPSQTANTDAESIASFKAFLTEFAKESDRACVILGAARLDILLKQAITGALLPSTSNSDELLDGDAPLGTFHARTQLAFRLGLIDAELARALNLIRRIRNEFAHEASTVSLSSGSHRDRVKQILAPLRDLQIFHDLQKSPELGATTGMAREFRTALAFVCLRLEGLIEHVEIVNCKWRVTLVDTSFTKRPPDNESAS